MTHAMMKQKMRTEMQNATHLGGILICRCVLFRRLCAAVQPTFLLKGFRQVWCYATFGGAFEFASDANTKANALDD